MKGRTFYIVDVFAEERYEGNQLAVFRETRGLSDSDMQKYANETHFSETTFIDSDEERDGGFDVRIFTPQKEVPFAGHPTLGTAFIIQREIIKRPVESVVLNLRIGKIPVTFEKGHNGEEVLWMKQKSPTFGKTIEPERIAQVLNIETNGIDTQFPIQEVSTGLPFIIVPLKNLKDVARISIQEDYLFPLVEKLDGKAILVFTRETIHPHNDLHVRVFAHYYGVGEDPATGSGNGCLAAYLTKTKYLGKDHIDIRVEQGYEIGRPSLLSLKTSTDHDTINVSVGGKVVMVAQGTFL
jgi:trans-2,3-dihydro-3-hydroxyanthranilate isomerase